MNRIIGISAVALVMGTAMASAQSVQTPSSGSSSERNGSITSERSGAKVVTPGVNDPDTTNRNQDIGIHKDRLPNGGTTGPIEPNANGG